MPVDKACVFMTDLFNVWADHGYAAGVRLGPFDTLVDRFCRRPAQLPCIWQVNCAEQFISIGSRGNMAQCDCWVTSYPEHSFGNVLSSPGLVEQLRSSPARADFLRRPEHLVQERRLCVVPFPGNLPRVVVRCAPTRRVERLLAKDPYCDMYKAIFECSERFAREELMRQAGEAQQRSGS